MKVASLADVKNGFSHFVEVAQSERVIVTRHGKPVAIIVGVEGESIEALLSASEAEFWKIVRRKEAP